MFSRNAQFKGLSVVLYSVLGPLRLAQNTSVNPEARVQDLQVALKGTVSAEKALQGFETKTRELLAETEDNSVSLTRGN